MSHLGRRERYTWRAGRSLPDTADLRSHEADCYTDGRASSRRRRRRRRSILPRAATRPSSRPLKNTHNTNTHLDRCGCCTSVSACLLLHTPSPRWRGRGRHTSGSAAPDPRRTSGCSRPSCSTGSRDRGLDGKEGTTSRMERRKRDQQKEEQRRVLCLVPPPHDTLQEPQLTQEDHFPSTGREEEGGGGGGSHLERTNAYGLNPLSTPPVCFSPGQGASLHTCVWASVPSHRGPPKAGGGLLHRRLLDCIPLPQVSLHGLHGSQEPQRPATRGDQSRHAGLETRIRSYGKRLGDSPGHGRSPHAVTSAASPSHGLPPCCAGGLLQVREHSSHRDHWDQLASTAGGAQVKTQDRLLRTGAEAERSGPSALTWTRLPPTASRLRWRPPLAGRGLVHRRRFSWEPRPQDALQGPQADHSEWPPHWYCAVSSFWALLTRSEPLVSGEKRSSPSRRRPPFRDHSIVGVGSPSARHSSTAVPPASAATAAPAVMAGAPGRGRDQRSKSRSRPGVFSYRRAVDGQRAVVQLADAVAGRDVDSALAPADGGGGVSPDLAAQGGVAPQRLNAVGVTVPVDDRRLWRHEGKDPEDVVDDMRALYTPLLYFISSRLRPGPRPEGTEDEQKHAHVIVGGGTPPTPQASRRRSPLLRATSASRSVKTGLVCTDSVVGRRSRPTAFVATQVYTPPSPGCRGRG
ncbi:hypothetical protein EYF80_033238 [Liparis tanakae]|uniref:Uncharacterized protein n=1 Tax=Liparis tanakae TaxID=230148 RepID=A0A4Z2GUU7_9TELE|nr:hypothetical protein EYF80_033238 [Liparis tanakae]